VSKPFIAQTSLVGEAVRWADMVESDEGSRY